MAKNQSTQSPGILAEDPMAEAIRKTLRFHFQVMVDNEAGSRVGENIKYVHDMRVAVRRMRAAFRLFGCYFQKKAIKRYGRDLRQIGDTLGGVRDLDVFNREARQYLAKTGQGQDLTPLLDGWAAQREEAKSAFNAFLDGERYQSFVQDFALFVESPGVGVTPPAAGEPARYQVRHTLTSQVWQLYETVRAYETVLEDAPTTTMHALRIDCKRLRYTLEFFEEILGSGTAKLIKDVIVVQDHLGDLQDAVVADALLGRFLADWQAADGDSAAIAGVQAYRAYRRDEAIHLIATFAEIWPRISGFGFRERLAAALLAL